MLVNTDHKLRSDGVSIFFTQVSTFWPNPKACSSFTNVLLNVIYQISQQKTKKPNSQCKKLFQVWTVHEQCCQVSFFFFMPTRPSTLSINVFSLKSYRNQKRKEVRKWHLPYLCIRVFLGCTHVKGLYFLTVNGRVVNAVAHHSRVLQVLFRSL